MLVEIWSDVVCPWCFIGKRRFEKALEEFSEMHPDVAVDVAYRAFQLDPTAPTEIHEPVRDAYIKKFGGEEAADNIIQRVTEEAAAVGIDFNMNIAMRANTADAHRLLALAEEYGLQPTLKERLMIAYFVQGEHIGELEVLVRIASEAGIPAKAARDWLSGDGGREEVYAQLMYAADAGIMSVPTFVFNGTQGFSGAHPIKSLVKVLVHQASSTGEI